MPDWLNVDVGDITALPSYDGGTNSTTPDFEAAMSFVLDALAAENPDFVLIAGDLVMGHWDRDTDNRQIFGPVNTRAQKQLAIDAAADHYYGIWKQRFYDRGLPFHVALGDHEIGDNNWYYGTDKTHLVSAYKEAFARQFARDAGGAYLYPERPVGTDFEGTAYAFQHNNILFVTVDVFNQPNPNASLALTGTVKAEVVGAQLTWLDGLLSAADANPSIDHVIVQGHTPCLVPVRAQWSSAMTMPGAESTEFWQTLMNRSVDLYLSGEVHDMTASNFGGVEQIAHGGLLGYANDINYLVGHVTGKRIDLVLKSMNVTTSGDKMWQTGGNRPSQGVVLDDPAYATVGTLTIDKSSGWTEYLNRTGLFEWFTDCPTPSPEGEHLLVHLACDETSGKKSIRNKGATGSRNHAWLEGGATFVLGKLGNAVALDGVDDRVLAGLSPIAGVSSRTVSAWVKTTTTNVNTVLSLGVNEAGSKWDVEIDGRSGGNAELGVGGGRTTGTGISVNDGTWHMVTTVLPNGGSTLADVEVYVDGEFQYRGTNSSRTIDTWCGSLILGHAASDASVQVFSGTIDDVAIWDWPLSSSLIRSLYNLANTHAMNASDVDAFLSGQEAVDGIALNGLNWFYYDRGVPGGDGEVVDLGGGEHAVNLGGGRGYSTVRFNLRSQFLDPGAEQIMLSWGSLPGTVYSIMGSVDFQLWTSITSNISATGTITQGTFHDPGLAGENIKVYRVER